MIDWAKLEDYDNNKNRSFEELCFQIAKELYGDKGKFTPVDDSGGGDGVEFYLTLPNGDEWGWQAKFFHPNPRLNYGNRKKQIEKSLKKACEKHKNLKKWFLCTNTRFTTKDGTGKNKKGISEKTWFETRLVRSIPKNFDDLEMIHWNESDFNNWLSEPRFNGKKNYFFGELELNSDWFCTQYNRQMEPIQDRFNPILHEETNIDKSIHALLCDEVFAVELDKAIKEFESIFKEHCNYRESAGLPSKHFSKSISDLYDKVDLLEDSIKDVISRMYSICGLLSEKRLYDARNLLKDSFLANLDQIFKECLELQNIVFVEFPSEYEDGEDEYYWQNDDHENDDNELITGPIWNMLRMIPHLRDQLDVIRDKLTSFNQVDLHIGGKAGVGKTHISSNICYEKLKSGSPALLILGRHFKSNLSLREQLVGILDIPKIYSFNDFLKALETAAEAYDVRIPIIIDGLNESIYNGRFSRVWKLELPGLIQEIKGYKNLVLITTCRSTYMDEIWPNKPKNIEYLYGFDYNNIEDVINKYFNYYKIKADLNESSLSQFEHPIYLKIFCETKNPERKEEKNIHIGDYTLFEIFDEYLSNINSILCEKFDLHHSASFLLLNLKKIAEYLWKENRHSIPLDETTKLIDGKSINELNWSTSKSRSILDEGLLVNRDWSSDNEVVYFTYDLLGGYLIAKYLIEQSEDIEKVINSKKIINNLFKEDNELHPLYEDIRRCLAALIPIKTGKYLHDILDDQAAFDTSIESLFEIPNEYINENGIKTIKELFKDPQSRKTILNVANTVFVHYNHSFNIIFWNELLKELSITDRDTSWTEYLRNNINDLEKKLIYFEETCKNNESFSDLMVDRLYLLALISMWYLTSTVQKFRDEATRALYWYGRRFPEKLFDLMTHSFEINDPYVSERMLASVYGVCMAKQYDFKDSSFTKVILPNFGINLYDLIFKDNAPYATTHILKRDYARRIIEISLIHHPTLLSEKEKERIRPPYKDGGIREWGESEDKDEGRYWGTNDPMEGIVYEDPVSLLGPKMDKYNKPPEYMVAKSNLWWRVYQLGYSLDLFGEIDEHIESWNVSVSNYDGNQWAGSYGRKYVFIAVYELAGYRDDLGLLKHENEEDYHRTHLANIDPSFPVEVTQYEIIKNDFLDDGHVTDNEWIEGDIISIFKEYLILDELIGEKGPWVLLNGNIRQRDENTKRNMHINSKGILIKSKDKKQIIKNFKDKTPLNRGIPEVYGEYYVYAGEIPWCDTFLENDMDELSFIIGKKTVQVSIEKRAVMCNDKRLSKNEMDKLWEDLADKVLVVPYKESEDSDYIDDLTVEEKIELEKLLLNMEREVDEFGDIITSYGDRNTVNTEFETITSLKGTNPKEVLKSELDKLGLKMDTIQEKIEKERPKYQEFNVLVPVRSNHWEMHHSPIIPNRNVIIPNKEISKSLELCSQPQTFDLYEKDGNKASITVSYGEHYNRTQDLVYIRKDLLDIFLSKNNLEIIWDIYREKEVKEPKKYHRNEYEDIMTYDGSRINYLKKSIKK